MCFSQNKCGSHERVSVWSHCKPKGETEVPDSRKNMCNRDVERHPRPLLCAALAGVSRGPIKALDPLTILPVTSQVWIFLNYSSFSSSHFLFLDPSQVKSSSLLSEGWKRQSKWEQPSTLFLRREAAAIYSWNDTSYRWEVMGIKIQELTIYNVII